jgi:signal transduction histidine kinase
MSDQPPVDFSLLLASSVHDIKNSLSMLLQSLDEIITDSTDDSQNNRYSTLRGEASRINNALIYLLGLYHIQQEKLGINLEEIYVADFLEEQIASQQLLFDINNIQCHLDCDENLTAYFDENLVGGIIDNILVNGAKYTNDSLYIHAATGADGMLEIHISDNGRGYPESIINRIASDDRNIDFSSGSTNLGLYFAQQIANMHTNKGRSGFIQLSNVATGGGKFTLKLP